MARKTKAAKAFEAAFTPSVHHTALALWGVGRLAACTLNGDVDASRLSDPAAEKMLQMLQRSAAAYPDSPLGELVELHGNIARPDNQWARIQVANGAAIRLTPRSVAGHDSDRDYGLAVVVKGSMVVAFSGTGHDLDLPDPDGAAHHARSMWAETVTQLLMVLQRDGGIRPRLRLADSSRWGRSDAVVEAIARGLQTYQARLCLDGKEEDTHGELSVLMRAIRTSQDQAYADKVVQGTARGRAYFILGDGNNASDGYGGPAIFGKQSLWFTHRIRQIQDRDPVTGQEIMRDPIRTRKEPVVWEVNSERTPLAAQIIRAIAEDDLSWASTAVVLGKAGVLARKASKGGLKRIDELSNGAPSAKNLIVQLCTALRDGHVMLVSHPRKEPDQLPRHLLEADDNTVPRMRVTKSPLGEKYRIQIWVPLPVDEVLASIPAAHIEKVLARAEAPCGRGSVSGLRFPMLRTCEQDVDETTRRSLLSKYPSVYLVEVKRESPGAEWPTLYDNAVKRAVLSGPVLLEAAGRAVIEAAELAHVSGIPLRTRSATDTTALRRGTMAEAERKLDAAKRSLKVILGRIVSAELEGDTQSVSEWTASRDTTRSDIASFEATIAALSAGESASTAAPSVQTVNADMSTLVAWAGAMVRYPQLTEPAKAELTRLTSRVLGKTLTWELSADEMTATISFTVDAKTDTGDGLLLPVTFDVPAVMVGQSRAADANRSPRRVAHLPRDIRAQYAEAVMAHGRSIDDLEKHRMRDNVRHTTPTWRYTSAKLRDLGVVHSNRRSAILDCPDAETRAELWRALNGTPQDNWERNLVATYTSAAPWAGRRWAAVDDAGAVALHSFLKEHGPATAAQIMAATGLPYSRSTSTVQWSSLRTAVLGPKPCAERPWGENFGRGAWVQESASGTTPIASRTFSLTECGYYGCSGHLYPLPVPEVPGGVACEVCRRPPGFPVQHSPVVPPRYFTERIRLSIEGEPGKRPHLKSYRSP